MARVARFCDDGGQGRLGFVDQAGLHPFSHPVNIHDILRGADDLAQLCEDAAPPLPVDSVKLLAPIVDPPQFIGIGLNYRDHATEAGLPLPTSLLSFAFHQSAIIGPGESIAIPRSTVEVDWEAELGVVIGRAGRDISVESAFEHVAGYLIVNDVSARDIQSREGQWTRAKSMDTFKPLGPWLVTSDELTDPGNLSIDLWVNDTKKQESNTSEMVFSIAEIVSFLSEGTTLLPGTVIATGTPSGVGAGREPKEYLEPGDAVTVEIEAIGRLTNPVVNG